MTQWHPLFARLLRPLLEGHYEVLTDVPVGDAPRSADIVLVRRTTSSRPPFRGIWRWLTAWNVLEFKGPTVSARVGDLDLLIELGLGIHRRLQGETQKEGQPPIPREHVAFWYLANDLGPRFRKQATEWFGPLEPVEQGIYRTVHLGRSVYLVENREVRIDRDSIPLHLLVKESKDKTKVLAHEIASQPDLFATYAGWLAVAFPALKKEMLTMARKMGLAPRFDLRPLIEEMGVKEVVKQLGLKEVLNEVGLKEVINEVGLKEVINEVGMDDLMLHLTDRQKKELLRRLQN